ncbi:hypothetical protein OHS18_18500 [Amycolatopsis sp. NBC_00355]|uniref:hypothetical protein n=1 Tax=Amycolatopsis sp. NBC_00355 TaxID=2975957 RepID=UPI002E271DFE
MRDVLERATAGIDGRFERFCAVVLSDPLDHVAGDDVPVDAPEQNKMTCVIFRRQLFAGVEAHPVTRVARPDVPVQLDQSVRIRVGVERHEVGALVSAHGKFARSSRGSGAQTIMMSWSWGNVQRLLGADRAAAGSMPPRRSSSSSSRSLRVPRSSSVSFSRARTRRDRSSRERRVANKVAKRSSRRTGGRTGFSAFSHDEISETLSGW